MRNTIAVVLVAALAAAPAAALAQDAGAAASRPGQQPQAQQPRAQQTQTQPSQSADPPSPADLGISLNRIRRELRELPPVKSLQLRYDFHVDVYGQNPKIDFFKDFDLSPNGPVRWGGMTHREFLNVVTPQEYRAPSGDLLGLAVFALQQLRKKE